MNTPAMSRKEALETGKKTYIGHPCLVCDAAVRNVHSCRCVNCCKTKSSANYVAWVQSPYRPGKLLDWRVAMEGVNYGGENSIPERTLKAPSIRLVAHQKSRSHEEWV